MTCPYCNNEMVVGKIRAVGRVAGLTWNDEKEEFRLNDEPKFVAAMNGDRMTGYRCAMCKKIIIEYE